MMFEGGLVSVQGDDAAGQDALDFVVVELLEGPRADAKFFQSAEIFRKNLSRTHPKSNDGSLKYVHLDSYISK